MEIVAVLLNARLSADCTALGAFSLYSEAPSQKRALGALFRAFLLSAKFAFLSFLYFFL